MVGAEVNFTDRLAVNQRVDPDLVTSVRQLLVTGGVQAPTVESCVLVLQPDGAVFSVYLRAFVKAGLPLYFVHDGFVLFV